MNSYCPDEVTPSLNENNWDRVFELRRMCRTKQSYKDEYLESPEWRITREWANRKLGPRCVECGHRGDKENWLEVDHLNYGNIGCERLGDLEVVCHEDHMNRHGFERNYV
jgi:hypothetical protein